MPKQTWKYTVREVVVRGDIAIVPLSDGRETVIDVADLILVADYNWTCIQGYAARAQSSRFDKKILLHRLIAGAQDGEFVDHIDRDRLNNRRSSLRIATKSQNGANRTKMANNTTDFKGVSYRPRQGTWQACIALNGRTKHLGTHKTSEAAAVAYDRAARELFGEFAVLNFPNRF